MKKCGKVVPVYGAYKFLFFSVDSVVEKVRLNVSVTYLLGVMKFVSDALPGSRLPSSSAFLEEEDSRHRLPSDCTSGYQSTVSTDEMRAVSLSVIFRKPEVVLFAQPDRTDTGVLVLKVKSASSPKWLIRGL